MDGKCANNKNQVATRDRAFAAGGALAVMLIEFAFPIDDGEGVQRPLSADQDRNCTISHDP